MLALFDGFPDVKAWVKASMTPDAWFSFVCLPEDYQAEIVLFMMERYEAGKPIRVEDVGFHSLSAPIKCRRVA